MAEILLPGRSLRSGNHQTDRLISRSGHHLVLQTDGNLVLYRSADQSPHNAAWSSQTNGKGHGPFRLEMQHDANLVLYDSHNHATWASNTNGRGQAGQSLYAVLQIDNNFVVYSGRTVLWTANTNNQAFRAPDTLIGGQVLLSGTHHEKLHGPTGWELVIQTDGNLVLYRGADHSPHHAAWASNTNGKGQGPFRLEMQGDHNLVVYDHHGKPTWASNTNGRGHGAIRAVLQGDNNFVVYAGSEALWATGTQAAQPGFPAQPAYPSYPPQPAYPSGPSYPPQPAYPSYPPQPAFPAYPTGPAYPPQPAYPPAGPAQVLPAGQTVQLISLASGQAVRIHADGQVDALGGQGALAKFIVSPSNGHVRFQNLHDPSRFLAIRDGQVTFGVGGPFCEFVINQVTPAHICLRSVPEPGHGLGFWANGQSKEPWTVADGEFARFTVVYC